MKKTPAVRFRQNLDAIKLLRQLEADGRMPTPKEQAVLGNYNGWGGLKDAFLDTKMNKELRAALTPEEYKAAQSTVNDAFYTPAGIVRAVWKGVSRLGFTGGRVLDKMTTEMIRARGRERLGIKGFSAERRESREVAA